MLAGVFLGDYVSIVLIPAKSIRLALSPHLLALVFRHAASGSGDSVREVGEAGENIKKPADSGLQIEAPRELT